MFQGDGGSPLICRDLSGSEIISGLSSFGYICGSNEFPGVYTEVSYFTEWIEDNLSD